MIEVGGEPLGIAVSPDGRWLAAAQSEGIEVAALDGTERATRVTTGQQDRWPAFRRSANELLFTRGAPPHAQVMRRKLGGSEDPSVVIENAQQAVPSPTDERVAYLAGTDPTRVVPRLFDLHTSADEPLAKDLPAARYTGIDYSPDGKRVVVVRDRQDVVEIDVRSGTPVRTYHSDEMIKRIHYVRDDIDVVRVIWLGDLWVADDPFSSDGGAD
jgi:hypothetical protein